MADDDREQRWADLMRAALAGDEISYRTVLAALATFLRPVVLRGLTRSGAATADMEDVVQETLLAIHLKRHTWRPDEPLGPWVRAIARNKMIDAMRRRGRRAEITLDDWVESVAAPAVPDSTDGSDVARLVRQLPDRQRQIVQSISVEGVSIRETAGRLGMTEGAVRVALHRSLKTLAALYRKDER